jgi:adenylate cyclase class 2
VGIEIEKKYRLTPEQRERVIQSLRDSNAEYIGEDFEENTLFAGGVLDQRPATVLRLRRRADKRAMLTYKQRFPSDSPIKHQREDETEVADADVMNNILIALGFMPTLVYEKRRETWRFNDVEVVVDELPFGSYMEIEGSEVKIVETEKTLSLESLEAEHATYPNLTLQFGVKNGNIVEARFRD